MLAVIRPFRTAFAVGALAVLTGCAGVFAEEEKEDQDPWFMAGVESPKITTQESGGTTTVTVRAETTLPLEDRDNVTGFAERTAKVAWRSHLGRMDELRLTSGQQGHPDRSVTRTWRRAQLEKAFGPRLPGLDAGDKAALRQHLAAGDGTFAGRTADRVSAADATLREVLQATTRERFGAPLDFGGAEDEECLGGIGGNEPTGDHQTNAEAEVRLPEGTHPVGHITAATEQWSSLGLAVDRSGLFAGNEDVVRATLPDVGRVIIEEEPAPTQKAETGNILRFSYVTDCLKP